MILVVNADDAGVDAPRNRGILRAAREGIVRSASLLVGFPAAKRFVEDARDIPRLSLGLHINLTEGPPIVKGHKTLTGTDGNFLGKRELFRRAVAGLIDPREARGEIEAQWALLESMGVKPSHADGHNHAHLFPGIAEAVAAAIPPATWVRASLRPAQDARLPDDPYAGPHALAATIAALSTRALAAGWTRFRVASRFEGLSLPNGYGSRDLVQLFASIDCPGDGVVELMTHPGEPCDGSVSFSASTDRLREVEALTSSEALGLAHGPRSRLSSFGDAA